MGISYDLRCSCCTAPGTRCPELRACIEARDPVGAGEGNAGHGGSLDGEGNQILRLEIVDVRLAAGARDRLRLEREHREEIGELASGGDRIEPRREHGILGGDAGGIAPFVPVVISAGGGAERTIFLLQMRVVVP